MLPTLSQFTHLCISFRSSLHLLPFLPSLSHPSRPSPGCCWPMHHLLKLSSSKRPVFEYYRSIFHLNAVFPFSPVFTSLISSPFSYLPFLSRVYSPSLSYHPYLFYHIYPISHRLFSLSLFSTKWRSFILSPVLPSSQCSLSLFYTSHLIPIFVIIPFHRLPFPYCLFLSPSLSFPYSTCSFPFPLLCPPLSLIFRC